MKKFKILIADDIPEIRMLLKEILNEVCREFVEAGTGDEVIEAFSKHNNIDIIFSDIEMPDMNGFEVAEYIRNEFSYPKCDVPIIAITSQSSSPERFKEAGFNQIVSKPYSGNELIDLVYKYCNS